MPDAIPTIAAPALVVSPDGPAPQLDPAKPATTTSEQDRQTYGQRRINVIWEVTQAAIAIGVTGTTLGVCGLLSIRGDGEQGAFLLLSNVFFLVVGSYFQRTNHTKTGGVTSAGDR